MFPLKDNKIVGYAFGVPTFYNSFHKGADYGKLGDEIYAPFDGKAVKTWGPEGGNTILFYPKEKIEMIRFLHCSKILKTGECKEGDIIGIVGETGKARGAHVHIDISKSGKLELNNISNFIDPETYDWTKKKLNLRVSILLNHKPWGSLIKHLANLENWFWEYGGIKLTVIPVYTNVLNPNTVFTGQGIGGYNVEIIEEKWFDEFIMPLRFPDSDIIIFNMERKDWQGEVFNHPELIEQGFCYAKVGMTYPIKAFTVHDENDDYPPYYPNLGAFAKTLAHEILHGLYQIIPNNKVIPGGDYCHNHFYGNPITGDIIKPEDCFKDFNI